MSTTTLSSPAEQTATTNSSTYNVATIEDLEAILSRRIQCTEEGKKYTLQVLSVSPLQPARREGGSPYYIINLDALTPYHMEQIAELAEEGEFTAASNVRITANVRIGKEYIPAVKEKVDVTFAYGNTKSGEMALFVDTITPLPRAEAKKFDLKSFMAKRHAA